MDSEILKTVMIYVHGMMCVENCAQVYVYHIRSYRVTLLTIVCTSLHSAYFVLQQRCKSACLSVPGVKKADVDFDHGIIELRVDPSISKSRSNDHTSSGSGPVDMLALAMAIEDAGYSASWGDDRNTLVVLHIEGMTCGHCVNAVKKAVLTTKLVSRCEVSLEKHECYVITNSNTDVLRIITAIEDAGYLAYVTNAHREVLLKILNWV